MNKRGINTSLEIHAGFPTSSQIGILFARLLFLSFILRLVSCENASENLQMKHHGAFAFGELDTNLGFEVKNFDGIQYVYLDESIFNDDFRDKDARFAATPPSDFGAIIVFNGKLESETKSFKWLGKTELERSIVPAKDDVNLYLINSHRPDFPSGVLFSKEDDRR